MELSKFSDRMATEILSVFDPLNGPSYSFTNGISEEEEDSVLPAAPPSDRQLAVHHQLNGHIATEQDLVAKEGVPGPSDGGKGAMLQGTQTSSSEAVRSTEEGSQAVQTRSRDSLEECPAPRNCEQTGEPEVVGDREAEKIVTLVAPQAESPESAERNEEAKEKTKALQFRPHPSDRSYKPKEPSNILSDRGSVIGHANLVKRHLEFFSKLPEKQRLSPRVRRLIEVGLCWCRVDTEKRNTAIAKHKVKLISIGCRTV